ncbi:MAG: ABC transporter permease [Planctomycetota bacterium]|nr:ABC transporter permease [Planctomycetota bacterium]
MSRLDEIRELTRVRVLGFIREPEAIFWVFVFPIVLAAVLGFAFRSGGIAPTKIAVVIGEGSDRLVEAFKVDEHLEVVLYESRDEAMSKLRKAAVDGVVEPDDPPKLTFDPVRAEAETARLRVLRALALAIPGAEDPPIDLDELTETGSRYVDFLFPGLIGMNLMGTGMWGIGFAIADVRRRKFLKRLLVTPMRRSSFFLSFMLSRLVFLLMELVMLAGFGVWVLGVPFRGDPLSFVLVCLLGALVFAGLGILVAARVKTIEGVSGLMNLVMVPMWLFSGVFFSYERFPEALHPVLRLLPLTGLNDALRAVMLDGESIFSLGPEVAVMLGWCVVSFAVALRIFKWE